MSSKKHRGSSEPQAESQNKQEVQEPQPLEEVVATPPEQGEATPPIEEPPAGEQPSEIEMLRAQLEEEKDKRMRLFAEFDNFRKRTQRDRLEDRPRIVAETLKSFLPVIDDFARAKTYEPTPDNLAVVVEGLQLISQKFEKLLQEHGVKAMECVGLPLNTDLHYAVSRTPVEDPALKGCIVSEVETGYMIGERVLRYAKVVVGF